MPQTLSSLLRPLASAKIFFYALIGLMILLILGTVSQKYIGLYLAQQIYFSSFIVWLGGLIPMPGGYTLLGLVGINLIAKLITERWNWQKAGTITVHCGALLLLAGGLLTAAFSTEGNMVIPVGESTDFISDYHKRELAIVAVNDDEASEIATFPTKDLRPGKKLDVPGLPFNIKINNYHANSRIIMEDENPRLIPARRALEDENNNAALSFNVNDKDYSVFEFMPRPPFIKTDKGSYLFLLRRKRTELPFEIKLINFTKETHPGTDTARSYRSEIILSDSDTQWRSVISMNKPLRYKGYTFFQSSFLEMPDGSQATVLAVVKNIGRLYPYIASIVICIGLLIHIAMTVPKLTETKNKRGRAKQ